MCVFDDFRSLLSEEELIQLVEACDMALELNQSKHGIYEYVESRMSFIAPNLSIIVGASTAAKLMGEEKGKKKIGFLKLPCSTWSPQTLDGSSAWFRRDRWWPD